mmetsp:Transcript_31215/g.47143  ORF Transcript_31215/g.47143 Transcript_31215/m.47143 type:complete len:85 (+) Transcript_31215:357-611(+)
MQRNQRAGRNQIGMAFAMESSSSNIRKNNKKQHNMRTDIGTGKHRAHACQRRELRNSSSKSIQALLKASGSEGNGGAHADYQRA